MSNKRITDLTELTNPTTDDVFPVVDIASNTTTKVQLGNLPVPTSVTTALATKENIITPGTTAQYFRGDKSFQTLDKTAVGLANVDNTSDSNKPVSTAQQTALNAKQDTLVSGTNIKTLNSTSLLGSGDIVLTANPSGVAGAIQFSNGSAFASDASNLFWDDTNNRLGVGTNAPSATAHFKGSGTTSATTSLLLQNSSGTSAVTVKDDLSVFIGSANTGGGSNALNQFPQRLYLAGGQWGHYLGSTQDGGGDTSLALFGLGVSGGYSGGIRFFTSNNSATPVLGMIVDRNQSVGIGLTNSSNLSVNASARLQVDSTTKGFLPPRMTTTQKNAIASPAAGLVVYDSTTNKLCCYNGSTWNDLF
jgi:hypothetical protein